MPASSLRGDERPSLGGSFLFSDHFRTVCVQNEALHSCREHHVSSRLQESTTPGGWNCGPWHPWLHGLGSQSTRFDRLKPGLLEHSQPPCSGGTGEQLAPVPLLGQRTHSVTASYHVTLCPSGRDASKCTGDLIIPQPQTFHVSPVPTGVHSASLHAFKKC